MGASQWLPEMAMWVRWNILRGRILELGYVQVGGIDSQDESTRNHRNRTGMVDPFPVLWDFGCHHHPSSSLFFTSAELPLSSSLQLLDLESHHHRYHRHHASVITRDRKPLSAACPVITRLRAPRLMCCLSPTGGSLRIPTVGPWRFTCSASRKNRVLCQQ